MASDEIVDPTNRSGPAFRRRAMQVAAPFAGVLLILLVIAGIGLHSYRSTRAGVVSLTHDLLGSIQRYVTQDVTTYLSPAVDGVAFAGDFIGHASVPMIDRAFNAYGGTMLRLVPQLQSFYLGDDKGGFQLVERDPHGKGLEYTTLQTTNGAPVFHHEFFDQNGKFLRREENPTDHYDPRNRAWYKLAKAKPGLSWGPPELYATTKQFVVTSSAALTGTDGIGRVFAVNISLDLLSNFLDTLKIGKNGTAIILDRSAHILAGHNFSEIVASAGGDPDKMVLNPKTQATFVRLYDVFRLNGSGSRVFTLDGKDYTGIASTLPSTDGWVVLIVAPESDFSNFARTSGRESLQFSVIIVLLACVLAGLLVRQARRSDRIMRKLQRHISQTGREKSALEEIAATPALMDVSTEAMPLTEQLARVMGAHRAAIWRFLHDGEALVCEDTFDSRIDAHSGGFELSRPELPNFFKLVDEGASVLIDAASADPRTVQFERLVMREVGSRSLILHPINSPSGVIGIITIEDATTAAQLVYFLDMVAAITTIRLSAISDIGPADTNAVAAAHGALPGTRFDENLLQPPTSADVTTPGVFPSVAVMVVAFSDPVLAGLNDPKTLLGLIDRIAAQLQQIAQRYELFSVKVAGHRLICTAGCTQEADHTAISRLAEAGLALRETCMTILAEADIEPIFSIGMDFGPAMGGDLGIEPKIFNLWGETVTLAEMMAQGAPDVGTIEVTERVYLALRDRYLFRSRGSFFAPRSGIGRVYTLAARR